MNFHDCDQNCRLLFQIGNRNLFTTFFTTININFPISEKILSIPGSHRENLTMGYRTTTR